MLTEEEKARIRAEEEYRAQVQSKNITFKTRSFTDTFNKIRAIGYIIGLIITIILLVTFYLFINCLLYTSDAADERSWATTPSSPKATQIKAPSGIDDSCLTLNLRFCKNFTEVKTALLTGQLRDSSKFIIFSSETPYFVSLSDDYNSDKLGNEWELYKQAAIDLKKELILSENEEQIREALLRFEPNLMAVAEALKKVKKENLLEFRVTGGSQMNSIPIILKVGFDK